ncbi:MAG: flagellar hook-basal body complex protein, partial [Lachnospiraceae bacterium]
IKQQQLTPDELNELNALANAYGYDSIDELNNLKVSYVADDNNTPDVTTDDTIRYVSVLEVFINNKVEVTKNGGLAQQIELQTVLGIQNANAVTSDALDFQGYRVVFDATNGTFVGIDGISDTAALNLSALTVTTPDGQQSKFSDIAIDFTKTTMFNNSGTSTITATNGDVNGLGSGRKLGEMIGISVQNNGMIYASYDNGQTKLLGQIAVAEFANASGLEKAGDNLYSDTLNSGGFDGIGVDITANGGYMNTGVLEMSNVDLSAEFTEMITTQRGFQANSRIITVSDTMLEELVNLKR